MNNNESIEQLKVLGWIVLTFLSFFFTAHTYGYRLNTSQSYPPGLYVISDVKVKCHLNDLILFCPPDNHAIHIALERGYVYKGGCIGGSAPMIKRIAATQGDDVALNGVISINGLSLLDTIILDQDLRQRPLTAFTLNEHIEFMVPFDNVFVYSEYAPKYSYDSRYFGPVPVSNIKGIATPVLLWSDIITLWEVTRLSLG